MKKLPVARTTNIVVQNLGKEILIYDLNTHKAYNLNETSSIVYQACDGETTFSELNARNNLTDDIIFLAIDELNKENLLEKNENYNSPLKGLSRREAIRKVGLASIVVLPAISMLVAPRAANAASGAVCNSCTANLPLGVITQFPIPAGPGVGGITFSGCVSGCSNCRCTIPGGGNSCTSTCTVN